MSSPELSEWMAYERIEPFPDAYWIGGMIASTVASYASGKRRKPEEFIPTRRRGPDPAAEAEATKARALAWFGARAKARGEELIPPPAT